MSVNRWIQKGHEISFSNEEVVYDYFEEASSGLILMHTALDNFANERIPAEFSFTLPSGDTIDRPQVEGRLSLPRRLDEVLPVITGMVSLKTAEPATWDLVAKLKEIRDDLGHVHLEQSYTGTNGNPVESVWSRMLAMNLEAMLAAVERTIAYYG